MKNAAHCPSALTANVAFQLTNYINVLFYQHTFLSEHQDTSVYCNMKYIFSREI